MSDRLLTVAEAAEILGTSERFPRRLIAERHIRFTRVGRHVRVPESALSEIIVGGLIEPVIPPQRKTPDDDKTTGSAEYGNSRPAATRP
jgi:excisionase family DNA binding protein